MLKELLTKLIAGVLTALALIVIVLGYGYFRTETKDLQLNPDLYSNLETKENSLPEFKDPFAPSNFGQALSERYTAVVRLHKEKQFICSAFIISDDYAVTANHCVSNAYGKLVFSTGVFTIKGLDAVESALAALEVPVTVIGGKYSADYALVKGNFSLFKKLRLDTTNGMYQSGVAVLQSPVSMACGYPRGVYNPVCYKVGRCGTYYESLECIGILYKGMSGGPVIEGLSMTAVAVNSALVPGGVILAPLVGLFEAFNIKIKGDN